MNDENDLFLKRASEATRGGGQLRVGKKHEKPKKKKVSKVHNVRRTDMR